MNSLQVLFYTVYDISTFKNLNNYKHNLNIKAEDMLTMDYKYSPEWLYSKKVFKGKINVKVEAKMSNYILLCILTCYKTSKQIRI